MSDRRTPRSRVRETGHPNADRKTQRGPETRESTASEASADLPVPLPTDGDRDRPEPVPVDREPVHPRQYVEITPSETPLDPQAVERGMHQLHARLENAADTGLLVALTGGADPPAVEWLLVADGRPDTTIRYLVGATDETFIPDLESVLRTVLPDTYELRLAGFHPRDVEEYLPLTDSTAVDRHRYGRGGPPGRRPGDALITAPYVAGVQFYGETGGRHEWLTPLTTFSDVVETDRTGAFHDRRETDRVPLAALVETLRDTSVPVIYQVVCRPYEDWSVKAAKYQHILEDGKTTGLSSFLDAAVDPGLEKERREATPPPDVRERIEGLDDRNPHHSFTVSARAVALTRDAPARADAIAKRLAGALGHVSGPHHRIRGEVQTDADLHAYTETAPGTAVYEALQNRAVAPPTYDSLRTRLPGGDHRSQGLAMTHEELPILCLLDGARLTPHGQRAIGTRPAEQTGLRLPPPKQLARYRRPGMALCMPLTHDRVPYGEALYLPPALQDQHLLVAASTGAGKSILSIGAGVSNSTATDGLDVVFATKGGRMATDYLRTHYAVHGSLEDVYYFDVTDVLPALSFFDIRPLLEAGIDRAEAAKQKADQYEEILRGIQGSEQYDRGAESAEAVRNHIQALFDPLHGADAFGHDDLYTALQHTLVDQSPPAVAEGGLDEYFTGMREWNHDMFANILGGATNRVGKIATDPRLAPLFDHVAEPDGPQFSFAELLDEDVTVVLDYGPMGPEGTRILTLVFLADLWAGLKAREQRTGSNEAKPLVNCYLDEAADVAGTHLVDTFLSQGRSFGISLMLGTQFPLQLRQPGDADDDTYLEALSETATYLVGNVDVEDELAGILDSEVMPETDVNRRLNAMRDGEWLVRPGADFHEQPPRPFLARSLAAPPGHPAGDEPLTGADERQFQAAVANCRDRTRETMGVQRQPPSATADDEDEDEDDEDEDIPTGDARWPIHYRQSLLPHTRRLPDPVRYDDDAHSLRCRACKNRYDPTIEGMHRAIDCCHDPADVDHLDVPVCEVNLKLTPEEIEESRWSLTQLLFVQTVYAVCQRRVTRLEYDIVHVGMRRLREYVGIGEDDFEELVEADVIRVDTDHPHTLYSVSPAGREVIGESYRRGLDFGHGVGDLEESGEHVFLVELLYRYYVQQYEQDPASDVEQVIRYYELEEGGLPAAPYLGTDETEVEDLVEEYERRRLDVAGLDADGNVVVVGEAERLNNDRHEAIPADYDKMADCDPEEAIWLTATREDVHDILETLNDPMDGEVRVEKEYSRNTIPREFQLDAPGATGIYPVLYFREEMLNEDEPRVEWSIE